jgi:hypothetical protein
MATARYSHTATLLHDGRVLIAGGSNGISLASAELYDPKTGTFSRTGSMATARESQTATLLSDGRVLIAGGVPIGEANGLPSALASAELYDPATGKFSRTGPMTTARGGHTATLLSDGRVLIVGGAARFGPWGGSSSALASAEFYDPATGKFSPTGPMTNARYSHTATLLSDGRVLIAGGAKGNVIYASAELYDPASGTFSPTGSMTASRYVDTATLLSDGSVLIVGGFPSFPLTSADLYDPATGKFNPTGSTASVHFFGTETLLSDGRVLVAGGQQYNGLDLFNELYDPATGKFIRTAPMASVRVFPTATLLPDGRVLIAGGCTSGSNSVNLASAELFDPKTGTH